MRKCVEYLPFRIAGRDFVTSMVVARAGDRSVSKEPYHGIAALSR